MNPKHHNPTQMRRDRRDRDKTFWAHAPYNFVPLPEKVVTVRESEIPDQDVYTESEYTGYIDCTLETLTPFYTRCALNPEFFTQWADNIREMLKNTEARHTYAQTFHLDELERPVIPGSTLRGMIRTIVEIVGYGKMQWVTDQKLIYRAVGDSSTVGKYYRNQILGPNQAKPPDLRFDYPSRNVRGGYLIRWRGGWAIQPAREIEGETFVHVEYEDAEPITHGHGRQKVYDVYVKPAPRRPNNRGRRGQRNLTLNIAITDKILPANGPCPEDMVPGKLVESGHMEGRHSKHWHCVIYEPDSQAPHIPIPDKMWLLYEEDSRVPRGLPTRQLRKGDPLFYLVDDQGKLVFFGPTMMFRLPYPRSPLDLVPAILRNPEDTDLAEAIFGYVEQAEQNTRLVARAGRVFFTDAVFESAPNGLWLAEEPITPKILSSPKPTAFQHYLVQDKDKGHDPDDKRTLAHYATPPEETTIRGHKLYWHREGTNLEDIRESADVDWSRDTQHTQIRPVKAGARFRFRIYFENLRDFELGALLWALMLPGEAGKEYHHKLGMGKSLGMGSVKIVPVLYLSNRRGRYMRLFRENTWHLAENEQPNIQSFLEAFERYVLENMDPDERNDAQTLCEVGRIRMLLKILEWPGPADQIPETLKHQIQDYMVIEPLNEYKERPVLPDPYHVQPPSNTSSSRPTRQNPRRHHSRRRRR